MNDLLKPDKSNEKDEQNSNFLKNRSMCEMMTKIGVALEWTTFKQRLN